jgi:hypothetical protein
MAASARVENMNANEPVRVKLPSLPAFLTSGPTERFAEFPMESFQKRFSFLRFLAASTACALTTPFCLYVLLLAFRQGVNPVPVILFALILAVMSFLLFRFSSLCLTGFSNAIRLSEEGLELDFRTNGVVPWNEISKITPYLGRLGGIVGLRAVLSSSRYLTREEQKRCFGLYEDNRVIDIHLQRHRLGIGRVMICAAKQLGGTRITAGWLL